MKFVCDGMVLSDAAMTVSKACAVKTINPVLECIYLHAENDILTLSAYDGEISIRKQIHAEVMEEGEFCVNGKTFADFVGKISSFEVVISSDEKGIIIRYADSESYMQALPTVEFPRFEIDPEDDTDYFEIKQNDLKDLISKVVFCCASDGSRPILKGALLQVKEDKMTATALDGFRMAYAEANIVGATKPMKIVCPARTLTEISRLLEGDDDLKIYAGKFMLAVAVNDSLITSRLYSGEFVNRDNIFPVEFTTKLTVKRSELIDSVERASVLIRGDKYNLINLEIKLGKMTITANSDMGKIEETVGIDLDGKELKVAMNSKYLLDAVKSLSEESIILSFNTSVTPFTLENVEDKSFEYLVLPLRTSN